MDVPWLRDLCPPAPFVRAGPVADHGAGEPLVEVLPGVVAAVGPGWADGRAGAAPRAQALAWATGLRSGVLVRLAAAWVWCGAALLLPGRVRVAGAPGRPLSTDAASGAARYLELVPTRWCEGASRVELGGVGVTDPVTTAEECLRLERGPAVTAALAALLSSGLVDERQVRQALDARRGARGRSLALDRLSATATTAQLSRR